MESTSKVRSSAQQLNRSKPVARCFLCPLSESTRLSLLRFKHNKTTFGATSDSAIDSSKFIPSTAAADSLSITAGFTRPSRQVSSGDHVFGGEHPTLASGPESRSS